MRPNKKLLTENEMTRWGKLAGVDVKKVLREQIEEDPAMGGSELPPPSKEVPPSDPTAEMGGDNEQLAGELATEVGKAIEKVLGVSVSVDGTEGEAEMPPTDVPPPSEEEIDVEEEPSMPPVEGGEEEEEEETPIKEDKTANKGSGPGSQEGFKPAPKPKLNEAQINELAKRISLRVIQRLSEEKKFPPKKK